jgi:hypothetical protein
MVLKRDCIFAEDNISVRLRVSAQYVLNWFPLNLVFVRVIFILFLVASLQVLTAKSR